MDEYLLGEVEHITDSVIDGCGGNILTVQQVVQLVVSSILPTFQTMLYSFQSLLKGGARVELIHVAVDNVGVPSPITECVVSRWTAWRAFFHFQTGERMGRWSGIAVTG